MLLLIIPQKYKNCISFWDTLGAMGPAWGMIGTLIGLVDMLYHMDNVATLGPAMAVALISPSIMTSFSIISTALSAFSLLDTGVQMALASTEP